MIRLGQTGVGSGEIVLTVVVMIVDIVVIAIAMVIAKGHVIVVVIISVALAETSATTLMRCYWLTIKSSFCAFDIVVVVEIQRRRRKEVLGPVEGCRGRQLDWAVVGSIGRIGRGDIIVVAERRLVVSECSLLLEAAASRHWPASHVGRK